MKRLKLNVLDYIFHYFTAAFLFFGGSALLIDGFLNGFYNESQPEWNQFPTFKFAVGLIVIGLWRGFKQYKRLYFHVIPIENISNEEAFAISKEIFKIHGWWIVKENETQLVAEGKSFRNNFFDIRTYRNRITIQLEREAVFINCIVEPPRNGQFITFGKMNQLYDDFTNFFGEYLNERRKEELPPPNTAQASGSVTPRP